MEVNRPDYFNKFDFTKSYQRLLYIAGRPLQSAELNEMQDVVFAALSKVGKYLVSNGTILSGGSVVSLSADEIVLADAIVSINGVPINVLDSTVLLDSTEDTVNIVGAAIKTTLVTGLDDTDILEPDPQSPHFGADGAYREKMEGTWKTSTQISGNEEFFPIMTIQNGVIVGTQSSTDQSNAIAKAISKYDFGVHGSYVVNGMVLSDNGLDPGDGSVMIGMSSGVARVSGNEYGFNVESEVRLNPISDLRAVLSEPIQVASGTGTYALRNLPVKQVNKVSGTKEVLRTITRGPVSGGADLLPDTPVLALVLIKQGGTTYTAGVDFKQTGDSIDWSLAGAEPAPGSSYQATYRYIANFQATTDGSNLVLADDDKNALVPSSTLYIDYDFYLSRVDRIVVTADGSIKVTKGVPGLPAQVQSPALPVDGSLSLGTVKVTHGVSPVIDQNGTIYMVPFSAMKQMQSRMDSFEYNIAQLSLKDEARATDPTTVKKGVVVDSLLNDDQRDSGISQIAVIVNQTLKIRSNMSDYKTSSGDTALNVSREFEVLSNPWMTKEQRINPYAGQGASMQADLSLVPSTVYGNTWWWWWHGNFMPRNTTVMVELSRFDAGEIVKVSFRGSVVGQGTASAQGSLSYALTIPMNTQYGSYEVRAVGQSSGAVATGIVTARKNDQQAAGDWGFDWTGGEVPQGYDPVAQTFVLDRQYDISSFSIYLKELPTNALFAKLVPTAVGIPDSTKLLGIGSLSPSQCVLGWNKITLKRPVRITAGTEYAVIIATANYQGKVATARVGEYDSVQGRWLQNQALNGVLLLSANERTWTPAQDEDLALKIHAVEYSATTTTKVLSMTQFPNNASEFMLSAQTDLPPGTTARFYLKVGSTEYDINVNAPTFLQPIPLANGPIDLYCEMKTSDQKITPRALSGVGLYAGVIDQPGDYVMRQFAVPDGSVTPATLKIIVDSYVPAGATVSAYYQLANQTFAGLSQDSSVPLGDGWNTVTYKVTGVNVNQTRIKLGLNTSNPAQRPEVKNIRVLIS